MSKADRVFAALADPARRRAVELLGERPRRAGELADALGLTPPAMSRHLKILKETGLIEDRHPDFDARVRVYALRAEGLSALKKWVDETDRLWSRQLAAFKAHAERRK